MSSATPKTGGDSKDAPPSSRQQRRLELRLANSAAWERGGLQQGLGKLDTSLKRHTALLVKFRSSLHTPASIPPIVKEITQLSLEKYVEEAVGAVVEGLAKCKTGPETAGAVEVISTMHQRFPDLFTPPFSALLLTGLKPTSSSAADKDIREKEDNTRIIKQRGLLRVVGELEAVGIVRKDGGKGVTGELTWGALKDLLTSDKESLALVAPLAIAFAKHLGSIYLPPVSSSSAIEPSAHDFPTLAESSQPESEDALVSREQKEKFRKLLVAYFEALGKREQRLHLELQRQDKRNHEAYIRSGEVFEDREKNYEKAVKAWERGWSSVSQLSELLALPLPVLPSLQNTLNAAFVTGGGTGATPTAEEMGPGSLWVDEEEKRFYEVLRDLRGEVPAAILGVPEEERKVEKGAEGEEGVEGEAEKKEAEEEKVEEPVGRIDDDAVEEEPENPIAKLDASTPDASIPAGPAAQLNALFARLPEASSKDSIDSVAFDFAFLNSKAARKRLVKVLGSVGRNRQDILPYYSRLVGTLNPYMPEVGKELVAVLEDEFRYLQKKRNVDLAETRSKNLRFISELTKFKVTPMHVVFYIFKTLLEDFSGPNIDNFCTMLENCGRFLLRSEATNERMRQVLEMYKRKKSALHLDERQNTMLENAYYQCDPPERAAVAQKERSPMVMFIRHLFYNVLNRNSSDKVLKLVRKLHWEDPTIVRKLHNAFVKVWKIKYSNVHLFAVLLYDLARYHPDFSVSVIDDVLENIRVGMEVNNFKYNQQRIATVKYLGELYNYRVVESRLIFDTLWSLVTFGHPDGRPYPDVPSPIDMPDDCFRVRLVCTLLDTCGACFDRGSLKKKLDNFLVFFQLYVLAKGSLPMDVGFMYSDTLESLRPKLVLFKTFPEANVAVEEMLAANASAPAAGEAEAEAEEEELREGQEGEEGQGPRAGADEEGEEGSSESESDDGTADPNDPNDPTFPADDEDDEDGEGRGIDPNAITEEEEDEFNRELAKMMVASNETRKVVEGGRKPVALDVGIPLIRRAPRVQEREDAEGEGAEEGLPKRGMQFTLLTKKGNKQQALSMEIPLDSSIAMSTTLQREQNKVEQEKMKRLVLDYDMRQEEADKQAYKESLARRGVTLTYGVDNRRKGVKRDISTPSTSAGKENLGRTSALPPAALSGAPSSSTTSSLPRNAPTSSSSRSRPRTVTHLRRNDSTPSQHPPRRPAAAPVSTGRVLRIPPRSSSREEAVDEEDHGPELADEEVWEM